MTVWRAREQGESWRVAECHQDSPRRRERRCASRSFGNPEKQVWKFPPSALPLLSPGYRRILHSRIRLCALWFAARCLLSDRKLIRTSSFGEHSRHLVRRLIQTWGSFFSSLWGGPHLHANFNGTFFLRFRVELCWWALCAGACENFQCLFFGVSARRY